MITLDQIRTLEDKVEKAVLFIDELKEENQLLKKKLENYQEKIDELEILITDFKDDQQEIEQGILNALQNLDRLEDDLVKQSVMPTDEAALSEDTPAEPDEIDDVENAEITAVEEEDSDEDGPAKTEGELDIF
jgi:chromosome segregation ATPase